MKLKVNIRDYLEDHAGHGIDVQTHVEIDDLLEAGGIPDEDEIDFDLDDLLEEQRQVAVLWTTDHVKYLRPDLSADQAWEVLKTCRARWGSCQGIDWETLKGTADDLYRPPIMQRWHGRLEVTIDDADGYGQQEALARFHDMAQLLARDMPDVKASVLEGSVSRADALQDTGLLPEGRQPKREQEEPCASRITAQIKCLQDHGDEQLLDDLMHELHGGEEAAAINNNGYQAQVEAAFRALGPEDAEDCIQALIGAKPVGY